MLLSATKTAPLLPALALGFALTGDAVAQTSTQDHTIDLELFRPHTDAYGYFHTQSGATLGHLQIGTGFWINYSNDPLVLVYDGDRVALSSSPDGDEDNGVVDDRFMSNLHLGVGYTRYFSLTADLPLLLWQDGYLLSSIDNPTQVPESLIANGVSDLKLNPKVVFVDRDYLPLGVSLALPLSIPTGNGGSFLGEENFTFQPTLIAEYSDGSIRQREYHFRTAINLGFKARKQARLRDVTVNNEWVYGLGVGYRPVDPIELVMDFHGGVWGPSSTQAPAELLLGVKGFVGQYVVFNVGGGTAIIGGVGAPDYRLFAGITVAPTFDPNARDSDKDTIVDGMDRCPKEPEDLDGYQDEDGCPEHDNDADGIEDEFDQCPNDPEDDDGYMDVDGCPDPDNDKDDILDIADRCPDEAETMNEYMDEDGCPDERPIEDTDGDGYKDDVDRCPYDAEDFDGFEDEDGCPEDDNDNDGVPDAQDKCPDEREIFNHFEDEDGCPDESQRVVVTEEAIEIKEKIFFEFAKATIQERSFDLLDEIASVLLAHEELKKIRVEGHTDNVGNDLSNLKLSQARADAVKNALLERGLQAERLDARGFGEMYPVDTNDNDAGRANNRRVEFIIVSRDTKTIK